MKTSFSFLLSHSFVRIYIQQILYTYLLKHLPYLQKVRQGLAGMEKTPYFCSQNKQKHEDNDRTTDYLHRQCRRI